MFTAAWRNFVISVIVINIFCGTYVEWFININMDGSMQRKAEVSDKLTKALRLFISIRLGHQ